MRTVALPNRIAIAGFLLSLTLASHGSAWNALGHKTVAEIAWRQLTPEKRQEIAEILRRHPRFDKDFAGEMTDDVLKADKATQDHWIFQHAATWPDIARNIKDDDRMIWDWPAWHYVNFPIYLDPRDRELAHKLRFNRSAEYPTSIAMNEYNVIQALAHCRSVVSQAGPAEKAIAYCWVFHLVGDIHQPLHSTALCSVNQFPEGDRGGNEIRLRRGRNLHSLWDGLLGRPYYLRDVARTAAELSDRQRYADVWNTAGQETDPRKWVQESHALCESVVYSVTILDAVRSTAPGTAMEPIELPTEYMQKAGDESRRRVIAAGLRLAGVLGAKRLDSGSVGKGCSAVSQGIDIFQLFPELAAIGRQQLQAYCDEWLKRPMARKCGVSLISVDHDLTLSINLDSAHIDRIGDRVFLPIDQLLGYIVECHFSDPADRRRLYEGIRDIRLRWGDFERDYGASVARRGKLFVTCKGCGAELETSAEGVEGWTVTLPPTELICPACGAAFVCDGGNRHLERNG